MGTALMARKNSKKTRGAAIARAIMEEYQPQTREEMQDAVKDIFGPMFEAMLQDKMDSHLGYGRSDRGEKESTNRRNGYSHKSLNSAYGKLDVAVPRERSPMRTLYERPSICGLWNCIKSKMTVPQPIGHSYVISLP